MGTTTVFFLLLLFKTCLSQNLEQLFNKINDETGNFSTIAASLAWESSINPGNNELPAKSMTYQKNRLIWQHRTCDMLATLFAHQSLNSTQRRQYYLLCRGPKFTYEETRFTSNLYEELQSIYSGAEICIPTDKNISTHNLTEIENAIMNYVANVKQLLGFEHEDFVLFAAKIAVNSDNKILCLRGEEDFEKMMSFSRKEEVLRWLWLVWREKVGPPMKEPYRKLVTVENKAARRNGYPNIGASWRDELEIPRLRQVCHQLYNSVRPLYTLLHGVIRFYLRRYYGDIVPEHGPIPAHLLGNLWSQNWEPLTELLLPQTINLDESIKKLNWTVMHMTRRAEDFYQSLGLPAMTDKFWRESVFARDKNNDKRCHGTAADMFQDGDFRLLYCSSTSKEDFYVLHHELGHIQYYMAYKHQPALFRQANTALHETIGDTIMYGVLTPQHLNRLGLINDSLLYVTNTQALDAKNNSEIEKEGKKRSKEVGNTNVESNVEANDNILEETVKGYKIDEDLIDTIVHKYADAINNVKTDTFVANNENNQRTETPKLFEDKEVTMDTILLLKQALNKIPQIPFSLLIDEYRWKYFEGSLKEDNKEFWDMARDLQGVAPPGERGEEYFDVGAKFHVPDNTPYIRYFLGSFLQHQLFEKLCKVAVFGRRNANGPVPDTISFTRCDVYGSKAVGKVLKDLMSRGHSQHWSEILQATIGKDDISSGALNRYYRPLYRLLEKFVRAHRVPIGW